MVATVSAPPAVVCFKQYVFHQRSRSAAVATCSLFFGPSATRSHSFIVSSVFHCDKVVLDTGRLSDIARECCCTSF